MGNETSMQGSWGDYQKGPTCHARAVGDGFAISDVCVLQKMRRVVTCLEVNVRREK